MCIGLHRLRAFVPTQLHPIQGGQAQGEDNARGRASSHTLQKRAHRDLENTNPHGSFSMEFSSGLSQSAAMFISHPCTDADSSYAIPAPWARPRPLQWTSPLSVRSVERMS